MYVRLSFRKTEWENVNFSAVIKKYENLWRFFLIISTKFIVYLVRWSVRHTILRLSISTKFGSDIRFGRISGRILDIEIIRPVIHYCWIFSLTLLMLSDRISDNLVFYSKQNWHYPAGYLTKPDIRPNLKYNALKVSMKYCQSR